MKRANSFRSSHSRQRLSLFFRKAGPVISIKTASQILEVTPAQASMTLSKWAHQGWLKKIKRGLYVPVPIEASSVEQVIENVWILVPSIFGDAYIGGWSAAEHWGLTEQIFQSVCVVTSQKVRQKNVNIQNTSFYLKHVNSSLLFGLKPVWFRKLKISISDPHKTIIDMLDDPALGGGIQHVDQCLRAYLESDHYDEDKLIEYATKQNNGVILKRLGYLISTSAHNKDHLVKYCKDHITKGYSSLEPGYKNVRLVTKWGLLIPRSWQEGVKHD